MSVVDEVQRAPAVSSTHDPKPSHGYIPEVQGLRTVALVLVAVFHIWFGGVSGGVDVFLLISAFLLTRSLTRSSEAGHRPGVLRTIVRKFARLLPLAATTIALTVIAAWLLLPAGVLGSVINDAVASLTYTQNFHLQQLEVDYYALQTSHASLFQQFWSLSIQGQVFVLWPILHLVGYGFAMLIRVPVRAVLAVIFSMVFAASLTWSIIFTAEDQALAYFDTLARVWEFAAGSLLALAMPYVRLSAFWRTALGWLGLAAILSCGFVLPVESSFPGYAALWPVLGAAAVIIAAGSPTRVGVDRVLATGPLRRAGAYTYALYLVHWPILVIFLIITGVDRADFLGGVFVFTLSATIAVGMTVMVEKPVSRWLAAPRADRRKTSNARADSVTETLVSIAIDDPDLPPVAPLAGQSKSRWIRPLAVIVSFAAATTLVAATASRHHEQVMAEAEQQIDEATSATDVGLLAMGANDPGAPLVADPIPELVIAQQDYVFFGAQCAPELMFGFFGEVCLEQTNRDSHPLFLSLGNSHSQQVAAFAVELASITGVPSIRSHALPGCQFGLPQADLPATECELFWQQLPDLYLPASDPSVVVVIGTLSQPDGSDIIFPDLPDWIQRAQAATPDTTFVIMRDNPRLDFNPLECAVENGWDAHECSVTYVPTNLNSYAAEIEATGAVWVDLNTTICPNYLCRPQVGEVVTYFDTNHLTGTYLTTLTPAFSRLVSGHIEWWPDDIVAVAADEGTSRSLIGAP